MTEGVPSVLVLGLQVYNLVVPSTVLPMLMVDRGMLGGSRQSAVRSKLQNVKRFKIKVSQEKYSNPIRIHVFIHDIRYST